MVFRSIVAPNGYLNQGLDSVLRINNYLIKPTKFTLCNLLNSCTQALDLSLGSQVHARMIQYGYEDNIILSTKLVDLYSKCSRMIDAKQVFDSMKQHDHISWTSIIAGFSQNGFGREALFLFKQMLERFNGRPNGFTFASVISGCVDVELSFELGATLHSQVVKLGCDGNNYVISSLIDCYSKCGKADLAIVLFNETPERDVVLLNSMITACSQNSWSEEALKLFVEIRNSDIGPTDYTFSSVLNACATLTIVQQGRQIHSLIVKLGSEKSVYVVSSLIDMYSKCGNVDEARRVFDQRTEGNSILWTSMITGYANGGRGAEGLELFEQLVKEEGMKPDNICLTAVLTACNHAGLVDKAAEYFNKMVVEYGLMPEIDQYACMVDIYGKTGQLLKAKKMIEQAPFKPNTVILSSFLASCRVYGAVDLGKEAACQLFKVDEYNAAHYVTLANIYAEAGMWGEVLQVRKLMREKGLRKSTGWSWIAVEKRVHTFSVADASNPQMQYIYEELDKLTLEMMDAGYMPQVKYVVDDDVNSEDAFGIATNM